MTDYKKIQEVTRCAILAEDQKRSLIESAKALDTATKSDLIEEYAAARRDLRKAELLAAADACRAEALALHAEATAIYGARTQNPVYAQAQIASNGARLAEAKSTLLRKQATEDPRLVAASARVKASKRALRSAAGLDEKASVRECCQKLGLEYVAPNGGKC